MTFNPYKSKLIYVNNNYFNTLFDTYMLCNRGQRLTCVIVNYLGIDKIEILTYYFTPKFLLELYINIYLNILQAEKLHYKSSEGQFDLNFIKQLSEKYSLKRDPEYFEIAYDRAFSFTESALYEGDFLLEKDPEIIKLLKPNQIYDFLYDHKFDNSEPPILHYQGFIDSLVLFSGIKIPCFNHIEDSLIGEDDGTEIIIDEYLIAHLGPVK